MRTRTSIIGEYGDPRKWEPLDNETCPVCDGVAPCSHNFDDVSWPTSTPERDKPASLADKISNAVLTEFYLSRDKGCSDCGPLWLDDDEAKEKLTEIISNELSANGKASENDA